MIGMDILSRCVTEYDLAHSRIALHDPADYRLNGGQWMPMMAYNNEPTVRLTYEGHQGLFTIDTGNIGAIIFSQHTVERATFLVRLAEIPVGANLLTSRIVDGVDEFRIYGSEKSCETGAIALKCGRG